MADGASSNHAANSHFRQVTESIPGGLWLYHDEYCHLHGLNNTKVASGDYVKCVGKLHSLSALMKQDSFTEEFVEGLTECVQNMLHRHEGPNPDATVAARSRKVIDACFGPLDAKHHYRTLKSGEVRKSHFVEDFLDLLSMDNSSVLTPGRIDHYCWDAEKGDRWAENWGRTQGPYNRGPYRGPYRSPISGLLGSNPRVRILGFAPKGSRAAPAGRRAAPRWSSRLS